MAGTPHSDCVAAIKHPSTPGSFGFCTAGLAHAQPRALSFSPKLWVHSKFRSSLRARHACTQVNCCRKPILGCDGRQMLPTTLGFLNGCGSSPCRGQKDFYFPPLWSCSSAPAEPATLPSTHFLWLVSVDDRALALGHSARSPLIKFLMGHHWYQCQLAVLSLPTFGFYHAFNLHRFRTVPSDEKIPLA